MKADRCGDPTAHEPHESRYGFFLRRNCPGLVVARCGQEGTHFPHWHGENNDQWCRGLGLAGVCEHEVQMLNECDQCSNSVEPLMAEIIEGHNERYHPGRECTENADGNCSERYGRAR